MIAVIATVFNEGDTIHHLLDSLAAQTLPADEIIIVDGGSTDQTVAILQSYAHHLPLRVLERPGCNISAGRNIALHEAQADIIAITDAGVRLPDDWLANITAPLRQPQATATVSAGFFYAAPQNTFEAALGAATLPLADEIDPATFLPSSRSVALKRSALNAVQGYPEWLDYCEDLIFDLRLQATQPTFAFVPDAAVAFRPRPSLRAFFTQYYRYARGDGKADLWRKRHAIRYITYLVALPALLLAGWLVHPAFWGLLLVGGLLYAARPLRRLPAVMRRLPAWSPLDWIVAAGWIPVILATGDLAKMLGYPAGWRWRRRENPPNWRVIAGEATINRV